MVCTCFLSAPAVSVSNITVTRVNDTAVMIAWRALILNVARGFPSYVVRIMNRCEQVTSQSTTSTAVVVGGLMLHIEYYITVLVLTAGGTKEYTRWDRGALYTYDVKNPNNHVRNRAIVAHLLLSYVHMSIYM